MKLLLGDTDQFRTLQKAESRCEVRPLTNNSPGLFSRRVATHDQRSGIKNGIEGSLLLSDLSFSAICHQPEP